jgi:hypothetical protein
MTLEIVFLGVLLFLDEYSYLPPVLFIRKTSLGTFKQRNAFADAEGSGQTSTLVQFSLKELMLISAAVQSKA